jgi:hypothetical protein
VTFFRWLGQPGHAEKIGNRHERHPRTVFYATIMRAPLERKAVIVYRVARQPAARR